MSNLAMQDDETLQNAVRQANDTLKCDSSKYTYENHQKTDKGELFISLYHGDSMIGKFNDAQQVIEFLNYAEMLAKLF